MTLALIADIHGNLPALEAVLADVERSSIDQIVCLGDVASFGPQPHEILERMGSLNCPVVMGNTDASLLVPRRLEGISQPSKRTTVVLEIEHWCAEQLNESDRTFVRTFQPTVSLDIGMPVLAYHGSPQNYDDPITALTPDETLDGYFAGSSAHIFAGGHTHTQFARRYRDRIVMNPGSVGLPVLQPAGAKAINPPYAEYALVTIAKGEPSINLKRVPYDITPLIEAARKSGMPHAEQWLEDWL
jgi:predicted phosphodiesterase